MSKGRGGEGERGTATERKCCAYLTDTDTHINGTDCAAPIAESYLNYIYMALVPSCASSSSSSSSSSASLACQRCRRPHPKPRRICQPVLSALRQWKRWEKRMNERERESQSDCNCDYESDSECEWETTIQQCSEYSDSFMKIWADLCAAFYYYVRRMGLFTSQMQLQLLLDVQIQIQIRIRRQILIPDTFNVRIVARDAIERARPRPRPLLFLHIHLYPLPPLSLQVVNIIHLRINLWLQRVVRQTAGQWHRGTVRRLDTSKWRPQRATTWNANCTWRTLLQRAMAHRAWGKRRQQQWEQWMNECTI